MKENGQTMKNDPFGNLTDWGPVLTLLKDLGEKGELAACQPGLARILRYRGNWRLREEVLKQAGQIKKPSADLFRQVLAILNDDNIYFDARILATSALIHLLQNTHNGFRNQLAKETRKVVERLTATPQPPFLEDSLKRLCLEIGFQPA